VRAAGWPASSSRGPAGRGVLPCCVPGARRAFPGHRADRAGGLLARWPGGAPAVSALRGAPPGWFRPRRPRAWPQERKTGSSPGHRMSRRRPSPPRPVAPPSLLPRRERTARDPPAGRRRATSSPGTALRMLPAALQAARPPAGRGTTRRHLTYAVGECLQHFGHIHASGITPQLAAGVRSNSTLQS
jgi:hypothetical protein